MTNVIYNTNINVLTNNIQKEYEHLCSS